MYAFTSFSYKIVFLNIIINAGLLPIAALKSCSLKGIIESRGGEHKFFTKLFAPTLIV